MQKSCTNCGQTFEITKDDLAFYDKISPVFGDKKYQIPPPTLCPDCRRQRRLCFRNERNLYHRKCDLTGKQIVSVYAADKPTKVYQSDEWFTDKWSALEYGRDVDFSRPFFEQFEELKRVAPRMSLVTSPKAEESNCMYINFAGHSENCYMTFDSDYNRDSYYTNVLKHSQNCMDCSFVHHSQLCYECVDCYNSYNLRFSQNCSNCSDSSFLKNCIGCKNCFFCSNLTQKEYCIFNKQYNKEDYERTVAKLKLGTFSGLDKVRGDFPGFTLGSPRKYRESLRAENAIGNHLNNVQNCYRCFDVADAQDLRYCDTLYKAKDCCDVSSFGENIELIYESGTAGIDCYNFLFCFECVISCSNLIYCDECRHASHCFGCVSVAGKYCILNKQYTKEEYEALVPKIIEHMQKTGEWGEFFSPAMSPFGYNETMAQEYFPLSKEEVAARGWNWYEQKEKTENYLGPDYEIPDAICDVLDDVTKKILLCAVTGKPYKIIPQELKLYRDLGIPIPRQCPEERHKRRMQLRNPRHLWKRQCQKCQQDIETTYAPERPEIVYCEECYLASVY